MRDGLNSGTPRESLVTREALIARGAVQCGGESLHCVLVARGRAPSDTQMLQCFKAAVVDDALVVPLLACNRLFHALIKLLSQPVPCFD